MTERDDLANYAPSYAEALGLYAQGVEECAIIWNPHPEVKAEFDRFLARVKAETVRDLEAHLVGTIEDGTYLAPWATLTARDVREGIWHYYDQIEDEIGGLPRRTTT